MILSSPLTSTHLISPLIARPPLCLHQGLWFIFQSVLTTDCDWHLTNTPTSHLNAQMDESKSPIVSIPEQQWPLHSSVLAHHHHHQLDGHCCLHPAPLSLNSYSSHWSHHDIGPLSELIARVHSCCRVKVGNSNSFVCFPSLSRFEELSCIHFELRKDSSFHHSVVLVHNVFPQGLVNRFSSYILCMFVSSGEKVSSCFTFIF